MKIEWLGTLNGIESELVVNANFPITYIRVSGLRGKGIVGFLLAPFKLLIALAQSVVAVVRIKPVCVLGMGGFASGPGGLAAWLLRKPLVIHEQNAIAGLTNTLLYRLAKRVLTAFPDAFGKQGDKGECVGNPVRKTIVDIPAPEQRLTGREGSIRLLIVGGSLGAMVLNEIVPQALALMTEEERPEVWHQTGKRHHEVTLANYKKAHVVAKVEPFIADMNEAYCWADVIVCRSGALTVSEIASAGLASILVPYPHAVDDHQTANALYLERAGAAVIINQSSFTSEQFMALLTGTFSDRSKILAMAKNARQVAQLGATEKVADRCLEVCCA
jgi:UDP-N-acetylglucosamine--N-acetylmuramyl-(pentapeptide) pyrophosphoryl-undecaprenol N-acetylglucosamine transferase